MRLNRMAMDLGLTSRKRPKKSQYIVAAPVAKKEKNAMINGIGSTPLTFKDMENVVENRDHEERDFVVGPAAREEAHEDHATEQMVSNVVDKIFDAEEKTEDAGSDESATDVAADAAEDVPNEAHATDEGPQPCTDAHENEHNVVEEPIEAGDATEVVTSAVDVPEEKDAVMGIVDVTQPVDFEEADEGEEMNETGAEDKGLKMQGEVVPAESEKDGYDLAMDLLRIINENPEEATLKARYGSKWSLSGMIGTTFDSAKKMLADVRDYFAFHIGEIVALASNPDLVAGVVLFVDDDSAGVFDGEKILSYKTDMIIKTGKTFKSAMVAGGLNLR